MSRPGQTPCNGQNVSTQIHLLKFDHQYHRLKRGESLGVIRSPVQFFGLKISHVFIEKKFVEGAMCPFCPVSVLLSLIRTQLARRHLGSKDGIFNRLLNLPGLCSLTSHPPELWEIPFCRYPV